MDAVTGACNRRPRLTRAREGTGIPLLPPSKALGPGPPRRRSRSPDDCLSSGGSARRGGDGLSGRTQVDWNRNSEIWRNDIINGDKITTTRSPGRIAAAKVMEVLGIRKPEHVNPLPLSVED
ncbi:hypothetical protein [Saccharothrix texasensis]|uniref:hypothetical protein n=1 Tax=Saccharothrix texasensis TaxID=103734 RepID=UPI0011CE3250|nr:hypothetical protein [Saccharothrix texasensis]